MLKIVNLGGRKLIKILDRKLKIKNMESWNGSYIMYVGSYWEYVVVFVCGIVMGKIVFKVVVRIGSFINLYKLEYFF